MDRNRTQRLPGKTFVFQYLDSAARALSERSRVTEVTRDRKKHRVAHVTNATATSRTRLLPSQRLRNGRTG